MIEGNGTEHPPFPDDNDQLVPNVSCSKTPFFRGGHCPYYIICIIYRAIKIFFKNNFNDKLMEFQRISVRVESG